MHYIIGTQISMSSRTLPAVKPGMTSQQLAELSRGSRGMQSNNKIRDLFTPGQTYTLIRIYAENDEVVYKFSDNAGDIVLARFNSVKQGEEFIADARNEELPDYTDQYINKTD